MVFALLDSIAMTKKTTTISGLLLIFVGMLGFAFPHLLGMHLTPAVNFLHLATGFLALFAGTIGSVLAARTFCNVFGPAYGLLGAVGLLGKGVDRLLALTPDQLVFGTPDHVFHLLVGSGLVLASLYYKYEELQQSFEYQPQQGTRLHES